MVIDTHPLLDATAIALDWPTPMGDSPTPPWLHAMTEPGAECPFGPSHPDAKTLVRDLLRHGGFKPNGRNKPCNEYIVRVAANGTFPRINPVVDLTNIAVLHGGLPVSTVDRDLAHSPLRIGIAEPGSSYIFNPSGQVLDLSGLVCLFDAEGPCANAVKDSQRTKTRDATTRTLTIVWGTRTWPGRAAHAAQSFAALAQRLGASVVDAA